jgi:flagellar hook protein FlgE
MANEISTVQSLKAVDAWIDVINANINGGVRTAFKSSRLKFGGTNTNVARTGNATSLPLQFPEPGLATANTVIDFSQGALTASTEVSHLAIQGEGFFLLASPDMIDSNAASGTFGGTIPSATAKMLLTRDGEFRTDKSGFLVNSNGYYLVSIGSAGGPGGLFPLYDTGAINGTSSGVRAIFNDQAGVAGPSGIAATLTQFVQIGPPYYTGGGVGSNSASLYKVAGGKQNLKYSQFGSTVFDFGFKVAALANIGEVDPSLNIQYASSSESTILTKSLEASNASMTQSVPELSLAQKLFSALTKVLQISQTNTDAVINLIR